MTGTDRMSDDIRCKDDFFFPSNVKASLLFSSPFVATEMYMEGSSSTNQMRQWYKLWHYFFPTCNCPFRQNRTSVLASWWIHPFGALNSFQAQVQCATAYLIFAENIRFDIVIVYYHRSSLLLSSSITFKNLMPFDRGQKVFSAGKNKILPWSGCIYREARWSSVPGHQDQQVCFISCAVSDVQIN